MTLLQSARAQRDTVWRSTGADALPTALQPLLMSLVTVHQLLTSSASLSLSLDPSFEHLQRSCRGAGRRLEDLLDVAVAPTAALIVSRFVEPDLLPLTDALASFVGRAARARFTESGEQAAELLNLGDAIAAAVEQDVGPALLSLGLFSFEAPRPFVTLFDPRRHQLIERGSGPKDVVVDVQRFGRIGAGGRLKDPALVVVGGGS